MDLIKAISNSNALQIVQYLQIYGEATTKQISEALPDIPAPTLYRYINKLIKDEVLLIKEERKVRGSMERILAINVAKLEECENGDIVATAYQFLMLIYEKFVKYASGKKVDPIKDRLCMRSRMMALSDADYDAFMQDMAALMDRYEEKADKSKNKLRNISFISAPVEEEKA